MTRGLTVLMAILSGGALSSILGQDFTVRLINVKDGRPLANQTLIVHLIPRIVATTSADGAALIHLPTPLPSNILIGEENGKLSGCGPGGFSTREIIERGIVASHEWCSPSRAVSGKFAAKPGEVIIFVRQLHWWEHGQD